MEGMQKELRYTNTIEFSTDQRPVDGVSKGGEVSRSGLVLPDLSFSILSGLSLSLFSGIFPICPFPLSRPFKGTYKKHSRRGPGHRKPPQHQGFVYLSKHQKDPRKTDETLKTPRDFVGLVSKCSATLTSVAAPPPGARQGFRGPNYPRHPTGGSRMGCDRALWRGCSCDTSATHSKLRKEPRWGCSYTLERDRGGVASAPLSSLVSKDQGNTKHKGKEDQGSGAV